MDLDCQQFEVHILSVWVFIAPLLPGVSYREEVLDELFRSLVDARIKGILIDTLNPYPAVAGRLKNWYRSSFPQAMPELEAICENTKLIGA